ncbi:response regulator transcription factor [Pseudomonas chlororaphis]|uniref:response regulator transcription factor n=1 Tax=Pseudomonas chlororaphis TaxID=587753 RepID=UPI0003D32256|nr:response regulator transcription factor [Pseudomonas chlororaphis]AZD30813.1 capsula synthesis response regulator transcription regulator protein [Pseudomonas chlororaphis]ETD34939.1 LuxR family transcriptional regulator [Pseudomonas chlororaphis subsp. aurantiaca PB-St2]QFS56162.1 response regulator [Pseudomonas chlororaphis subsp. aurantiaca]
MTFDALSVLRVGVVDDHPLIRKAVQYSLENEPDMVLTASCKNRDDIIPYLARGEVDILVLDYLLKGSDNTDGLQLVKHLTLNYPDVKILLYTSVESPAVVQLVMKAGVKGFIGKSKELEELIHAIRYVAAGKTFLTADMQHELDKLAVVDKSMLPFIPIRVEGEEAEVLIRALSPREVEVIRCYLEGQSISDIAAKYNRSRKTISGQKQSALRKLGLTADVQLFKFKDLFQG